MDARRRRPAPRLLLGVLVILALPPAPCAAAATRVELTDVDTGRTIAVRTLSEGDRAVLTWRNSLFGLDVTEVFTAGSGGLALTSVTFADPAGGEPPRVAAKQVDDLYHTGGPFRADGLSRPIGQVVFRVGEIGNPVLQLADLRVHFRREVGFGGAVRLTVTSPAAR
jgi:hypothetical protein